MNHGLVLAPPILEEGHPQRHYVFGGFSGNAGKPVIMPGGHGWGDFAPPTELQAKNGFETAACSLFGTIHALCALAKQKGFTDFPLLASERYVGVLTHTYPPGNDPHLVIQFIRNQIGLIPQSFLPFSDDITTVDQFYAPKPMTPELVEIGKALRDRFDFGHDWVIPPGSSMTIAQKQQAITEALTKGTVAVSVYAWRQDSYNGLYNKRPGDVDEHWVWLKDYVQGSAYQIRDTYEPFDKELEWGYNFDAAKVYYLDRRTVQPTPTFGWYLWSILIDRVARGFTNFIGAWRG